MNGPLRALRALSDPTRLRIVAFLADPAPSCCSRDDGVCGCDLETVLGLAQPTISHHMKRLVEAGLVRSDKRGRWTYYELESTAFDALATEFARFARAAESTVDARAERDGRTARPTTS